METEYFNWTPNDMVEVKIDNDKFSLIVETLSRIGIANQQDKKLYQTCHIFHRGGRYYIVHFKELFAINGRECTLTCEDVLRRNYIVNLLQSWGLVKIVNPDLVKMYSKNRVTVLKHDEKQKFVLVPKYKLGKSKNPV